MSTIDAKIKEQVTGIIQDSYQTRFDDLVIEIPPRPEFGDIALPVAFELVKRLSKQTGEKQNPRRLAETIVSKLPKVEGVAKIEIAGPGYINIFLDRAKYLLDLNRPQPPPQPTGEKIIVEHTSVNPNKAAHIGHLRNAVLGDTLVRLLRSIGEKVEVHNYIDNTGVQVADVVVGFKYIEEKSLDEIKQIPGRFDYYCWDLYARVTDWYEQNPENLEYRKRTLKEIEIEEHPTAAMADYISTRVLNCHLDTLDRLSIRYDVLPRESDILHLHFWSRAFEILKQAGVIVYETEGRNKGCWVIKAETRNEKLEIRGQESESSNTEEEYEADKILVRSDGTVNYTGKDIAYHLWKVGRLGTDFNYKIFRTYPDKTETWITTSEPAEPTRQTRPIFGFGSVYLNVIGVEQTYPQMYVKQAIAAVAPQVKIDRCAHVAYEKVALSPHACLELGIELAPEEWQRQQISMSGRRGLGVKADDLIDKLEERAAQEVRTRHSELSEAEQFDLAHKIAVGALRYFLLRYTRTSALTFDFKEALSFEGETGPYLQYAVVRANSIFRKAEAVGTSRVEIGEIPVERMNALLSGESGDDLWSLIYLAGRLDQTIRQSGDSYEPSFVAKYAFQLAQRFSIFYHNYHILREPDLERRTLLITITELVDRQLRRALGLMGIEVPERM
ncbi:MAG: arginine--tRNA ligase [Acidobacteria bacterium]|nr:arginine--tRNA ligase [Acidobacteriota bacterium]